MSSSLRPFRSRPGSITSRAAAILRDSSLARRSSKPCLQILAAKLALADRRAAAGELPGSFQRLLPPPELRKNVGVHVLRVRNPERLFRVDLCVHGGLFVPPDVLERVREVVMRRQMPGIETQRLLVEILVDGLRLCYE